LLWTTETQIEGFALASTITNKRVLFFFLSVIVVNYNDFITSTQRREGKFLTLLFDDDDE